MYLYQYIQNDTTVSSQPFTKAVDTGELLGAAECKYAINSNGMAYQLKEASY